MSESPYYPQSLPNSPDAEKSVLGAVMQSDKALNMAMEELKKEDFFAPAHQLIFEAARLLRISASGPLPATLKVYSGKRRAVSARCPMPFSFESLPANTM